MVQPAAAHITHACQLIFNPSRDPVPKSIELHTEDQAFLRSYDSAPRTPPSPSLSSATCSLSHCSCVSPVAFTDGRGGKGGATARKPCPL
jgi:hypothetical protein